MSKYQVIRRDPDKSYGIYKISSSCHLLVKNLKEYTNENEAINDLTKLLDGEISERDLMGSNYQQDVETGKLGNRIFVLEAALKAIRSELLESIGDCDKTDKAARNAVKIINELFGE